MIAFAREYPNEQPTTPAWHAGFLAILPQIHNQLRFAFRRLLPDDRAEAMAECVANIAVAYARLHEQGKSALAFPTTLADYAIRQYFAGRRVGSQLNIDDVTSPYCQRQRGFRVKSLDQRDPSGAWKEIVVEDGRETPADVAASRIDLENWFNGMPRLKRRVAETLATGEGTTATAERFNLTAGRVSQLRKELAESWADYQGEAVPFA